MSDAFMLFFFLRHFRPVFLIESYYKCKNGVQTCLFVSLLSGSNDGPNGSVSFQYLHRNSESHILHNSESRNS